MGRQSKSGCCPLATSALTRLRRFLAVSFRPVSLAAGLFCSWKFQFSSVCRPLRVPALGTGDAALRADCSAIAAIWSDVIGRGGQGLIPASCFQAIPLIGAGLRYLQARAPFRSVSFHAAASPNHTRRATERCGQVATPALSPTAHLCAQPIVQVLAYVPTPLACLLSTPPHLSVALVF